MEEMREILFFLFVVLFLIYAALVFCCGIAESAFRLLGKGSLYRKLSQSKVQEMSVMNAIFYLAYRIEFHAVVFTAILALLLGLANLRHSPLLWAFVIIVFGVRLAEVFTPAAMAWRDHRKEEDQSLWTTRAISISSFSNVIAPILEYRYKLGPEFPAPQWWNWLGLLLLIAGSTLQFWATRQAGTAFTAHVKIEPKHKLVTAGPYALMRHPSYLGTLVFYLGIALVFSSVIGAIALAVLVTPAMIFRLAKEEQLLSKRFGEAWKKYQDQTPWRLIPRVW